MCRASDEEGWGGGRGGGLNSLDIQREITLIVI